MEPGNAPEADGPGPAKSDEVGQLFARAYHLDNLMGMPGEAEPLYQRVAREGRPAQRETALAQLRIATLCRIRGDRRCAMGALDWLINNADRHPSLARYAEQEMVELLHPQAGHSSALTRGPPVSFTRLLQVPAEVGKQFRDAEQALLKYVRVPLAPQLHNVDAVVAVKRGALLSAIRAYDPLSKSQFQNAVASGLFRQGSIHQDFAEALGRLKLPDELLAPVAARLRVKFHTESVTHFRSALEHYRKAAAIADPSAERWRQAAALAEAQLGRLARRQPGVK
jgi:tetratricopeptide (TPR) repeat protein